jgi:hypothetical protein
MEFTDMFSSYTVDIVSFFVAFLISYFVVQKINDGEEYLDDNSSRIKRLKVILGTLSFIGTFLILTFLLSLF